MIGYEPLWKTMAEKGITTYALVNKHGINPRTTVPGDILPVREVCAGAILAAVSKN